MRKEPIPSNMNSYAALQTIQKQKAFMLSTQNVPYELSANPVQQRWLRCTGNLKQRLEAGECISIEELIAGYADNQELFDTPLTQFDTPLIIETRRALAQKFPLLKQTIALNTAERLELRAQLVETLYGNGAKSKEQQLVIVYGSPGAGKSTCAVEPLAKEYGALTIDGDAVRALLPESQQPHDYKEVALECKFMKRVLLKKAMDDRGNIVYHTGGSKFDSLKETCLYAKEQGYAIRLVLVDVNPEEAAQRVIKRFYETKRFTDPYEILHDVRRKPFENYQQMKQTDLCDHFMLFDNNGRIEDGLKLMETL